MKLSSVVTSNKRRECSKIPEILRSSNHSAYGNRLDPTGFLDSRGAMAGLMWWEFQPAGAARSLVFRAAACRMCRH